MHVICICMLYMALIVEKEIEELRMLFDKLFGSVKSSVDRMTSIRSGSFPQNTMAFDSVI